MRVGNKNVHWFWFDCKIKFVGWFPFVSPTFFCEEIWKPYFPLQIAVGGTNIAAKLITMLIEHTFPLDPRARVHTYIYIQIKVYLKCLRRK